MSKTFPIKPIVAAVERAHARLSASGSKKWLTCTRSASLEDQFPDEQSQYAAEGTFMHEIFELSLLHWLGRVKGKEARARYAELKKNAFWTQELEDSVKAAFEVAKEAIAEAREICKDPVFLVEQRLDFSPWVPEGFGTGDLVIITDAWCWVLDLKGGKGVPVDIDDSTQLPLYGLGAYNELSHLYDIKVVRMTILQPRLNNFGRREMLVEDLLDWAENVVKPRAQLAWDGQGEFVPGPHCTDGFCRARFQCPARAEAAQELAKQEFALLPPELLTIEQIAVVLEKADQAIDWLNDVKTFALKQAEAGVEVPGYKLVEGRSNRKYADQDAVAAKLVEAGIPEAVIYERTLLGITAMEKAIGKKKFAELLDDLVVKPQGKPVLAPVTDKRPALSSVASATEDFS